MTVRVLEMRKSPRVAVNMKAKIISIGRGLRIREAFNCVIVNISEGGALIKADQPIVDREFYLEASLERGGLVLCEVVRRDTAFQVGVRFL
jgi:hypothetical protein